MPNTRFHSVRKEKEDGILKVHYEVDQFVWYRDIIQRTLDDGTEREDGYSEYQEKKLLSGVRFHLPHCPGREAPSYVVAVGNGLDVFDVYFARINWGRDILTGGIPEQDTALWKLFAYRGLNEKGKQFDFENNPEKPVRFHNIPSTDISPFLHDHSEPSKRIYNFPCSCVGSDQLEIVANNAKEYKDESLEITYISDYRDSKPVPIITLTPKENLGFTSEDLNKRISTKKFTFSSVVNC